MASLTDSEKIDLALGEIENVCTSVCSGQIAHTLLVESDIYKEISRARWDLYSTAKFLLNSFHILAQVYEKFSRLASKSKCHKATPERTFHLFPRLPSEMRLMIWEAAASPPLCAHYFATHSVPDQGRPAAASFMEDGGLWTACRESRSVILQAYQKSQRLIRVTGCSAASEELEAHYKCLGQFNKDGQINKDHCCRLLAKLIKANSRFRQMSDAHHERYAKGHVKQWERDGSQVLKAIEAVKELRLDNLFQ